MTTIPARLAQTTRTSSNLLQARTSVIHLYRDWCRAAPEIVSMYALNYSVAQVRHSIRQRYEQNRYVTDPRVIDVLLLKSRQEYQETLNCWKQPDHVVGILLQQKERPHRTFLQRFYEGRDEDAVVPAVPVT